MEKQKKTKNEVVEGLVWAAVILAVAGGMFTGGFFAGRYFTKKTQVAETRDQVKKDLKDEIAKNIGEEGVPIDTFYGEIIKKEKDYIEVKGIVEGLEILLEEERKEYTKKIKIDDNTKITRVEEIDDETLDKQREEIETDLSGEREEGVNLEDMMKDLEKLRQETEKEISIDDLQVGEYIRIVSDDNVEENDEFLAKEIKVE